MDLHLDLHLYRYLYRYLQVRASITAFERQTPFGNPAPHCPIVDRQAPQAPSTGPKPTWVPLSLEPREPIKVGLTLLA